MKLVERTSKVSLNCFSNLNKWFVTFVQTRSESFLYLQTYRPIGPIPSCISNNPARFPRWWAASSVHSELSCCEKSRASADLRLPWDYQTLVCVKVAMGRTPHRPGMPSGQGRRGGGGWGRQKEAEGHSGRMGQVLLWVLSAFKVETELKRLAQNNPPTPQTPPTKTKRLKYTSSFIKIEIYSVIFYKDWNMLCHCL